MEDRKRQFEQLIQKINAYDGENEHHFYHEALQESFPDIQNEKDLCALFETHPELTALLRETFDAIMKCYRQRKYFWIDAETGAGYYLSEVLDRPAPEKMENLITFVRCCNIDAEDKLFERVKNIIKKYGYNEETITLFADYTLLSSFDEDLMYQLNEEMGFYALIQEENNADQYFAILVKEFNNDANDSNWIGCLSRNYMWQFDIFFFRWQELFGIDQDAAKIAADNFITIHSKGGVPKYSEVIAQNKPIVLQQGRPEEMMRDVACGLEALKKRMDKDYLQKFFQQKDPVEDHPAEYKIWIEGDKNNILSFTMNQKNYWNWDSTKYTEKDYGMIPMEFLKESLIPAIQGWVQDKLDQDAFPGIDRDIISLSIQIESDERFVWKCGNTATLCKS